MVKSGIADFAISEDSDLLVFGCPTLICKLNFAGIGVTYTQENIFNTKDKFLKKNIADDKTMTMLSKMRREQFVSACILSGCDYIPSVQGIGLKSAIKYFYEHGVIEKVI